MQHGRRGLDAQVWGHRLGRTHVAPRLGELLGRKKLGGRSLAGLSPTVGQCPKPGTLSGAEMRWAAAAAFRGCDVRSGGGR